MPSADLFAIVVSLKAALGSFAILAVMFVPLERMYPARSKQGIVRPGLRLDIVFFFGQYLAWNAAAIFVAVEIASWLGGYMPSAPKAAFLAQPFWLQAIEAILIGDVCVYWYHRASHRFDFLWRFHAVHHSSEHLDWVAAHREHPVDGILTQLAMNVPAMLLGFSPRAIAGFIVFSSVWAIFVHSNVRIPLGPLKWLFGAPEFHHWHHARVERTKHNFANLAPFLDVLFGTHHCPEKEETYTLGDPTEKSTKSYLAFMVEPFLPRDRESARG
ncbi:MAG TPA: sterol desaturase family protein [Polyangium sp.]|jgi:sterol desaturase/sphingolipid hydroxylase (fatty acid hydroxylase superfamily)|nr:sterol desaturase family protein [Polyangium sp.]